MEASELRKHLDEALDAFVEKSKMQPHPYDTDQGRRMQLIMGLMSIFGGDIRGLLEKAKLIEAYISTGTVPGPKPVE